MKLRPNNKTNLRRNRYKVAVDAEDGRGKREDDMIQIRKNNRKESLQKKRREGESSQFPTVEHKEMQISIKSMGGMFTLLVKSSDTIINVKKKIFEKERIPVHQQMLMFSGDHLNDNMTLADYNIQEKSTLNQNNPYQNSFHLRARMLAD